MNPARVDSDRRELRPSISKVPKVRGPSGRQRSDHLKRSQERMTTFTHCSMPLNFERDIQDGHLLIGMSTQPCDILHVPDWVRSSRVVLLRPLLLRRVVLRFVLAPAAQSSLIDASRACAEQWVQQQRKASRQNGAGPSVTERVSQCESANSSGRQWKQ